MTRAHAVLQAGDWDVSSATDTVLLDFDMRHRRRIALQTETGRDILLDLPRAARLREGDGLLTDTSEIVRVLARPEPLMEIHAPAPATMVRIAWHLGNRHLPVQVIGPHLRIRADHVIPDMVTTVQTAGLRVLAGLAPALAEVTETSATATLDDIGTACFRADIAALRHETQHTRLFRT